MKIDLAIQPYATGFSLRDFVREATRDQFNQITLVSAWVTGAALRKVEGDLSAFRARGGHVRAIVGIDLGGTTRQGLETLVEACDEAFVFHLPGRTFHPKVYWSRGPEELLAFVGSHNLTAGGLELNFEAALMTKIRLREPAGEALDATCREYVERLLGESDCCLRLTPELISDLDANPRYLIPDETDRGWRAGRGSPLPPDAEAAPRLFGGSNHRLGKADRTEPSAPGGRPGRTGMAGTSTRRWFKKMGAADAQQLADANRTNTLTLVRAGHDMDATTYFRDSFFGDLAWEHTTTRAKEPRDRETAQIEGRVVVNGADLGSHPFTIRHTPGYEAGQKNRTTELVWNDFGRYLREHALTGQYVTLERTVEGQLVIHIDDEPTGPFAP